MVASEVLAAAVHAYSLHRLEKYLDFCVMFTIFGYDYAITFGREVELFWRMKCTAATVIFLATRYLTLANVIIDIIQCLQTSSERCNVLVKISAVILYARYLPFVAFSGIRAYVLSGSRYAAALVTALALTPLGVNLVQYANALHGRDSNIGCVSTISGTSTENIIFAAISRGGLLLSDLLLVFLTWRTLVGQYSDGMRNRMSVMNFKFSHILLWNGTIYFVVMTVLNIFHISSLFAVLLAPSLTLNYFTSTSEITDLYADLCVVKCTDNDPCRAH
ncbi:hypothetical protein C8Q80DRAFT_1206545 [Daedaleopsis nitida]|nr:hypothetical protein C8Q80DRAFT_1206545 [Daedaleopsis nitida]